MLSRRHQFRSPSVPIISPTMVSYCPHPNRLLQCDRQSAGYRLFLNERDSDVAIGVQWDGRTWRLPAHRLILAAMSDVFRTMFDTDMIERNRGTITITDSSPSTVKHFLRYLYMGTLELDGSWMEAVDLLKIAHKYGVHALTTLCESHLTASVTFANVCHLYETAQMYGLSLLEKQASSVILEAAFVVMPTEGFLLLKPRSLEHFLKSKNLVVENEYSVLAALGEWAIVCCSRNGVPLIRENVLREMEPFLKHIRWSMVPESWKRLVPAHQRSGDGGGRRKNFHVAGSLQNHISLLKFVVELGTFHEVRTSDEPLTLRCLKFNVDNHAFVAGFRIVGMFRNDTAFCLGPSSLTLSKENNSTYTQFNLNSLPWTKGATVGDYVWRELTAYLPFPVRVDPYGSYIINLKYNTRRDPFTNKWPCTRLDSGIVATSLGAISVHCCPECYGITQLFILPAAPMKLVSSHLADV